ncbi:methyltransferase (TIGR00027 family) [Saccharothrix saharensis]|uniref:S-adenosyl-L-methionine-dependent methyltransferase n=1 Tax=Saccharothrix saharensis TaxID=571190 RepID=A0A543J954_9PSEU|nr:SAM-dependent methyltransferase [Saccharothrix saharensis]TQM79348.1 methyltransferase (TIGR00027 family) [Saccharothrix saharensis]
MVTGVAGTAVGPMVIAAVEQHRSPGQRLLHDPLAIPVLPPLSRWVARLAGRPAVRAALIRASERAAPGVWGGVACRKRYIDDRFTRALDDGIGSAVVPGAGPGTRAHRSAVPADAVVFEVDLPVNVAHKRERLPAHRRVVLVPVDLDSEDLSGVPTAHGRDSGERCLVVCEGVTRYLTREGVRWTFDFLPDQAPGSRLVSTYVRKDVLDGDEMYGSEALHRRFVAGRPVWRFGLHPHEVGAFLAERGWREVEQLGPAEFDARYVRGTGRTVPISALERTVPAEKR